MSKNNFARFFETTDCLPIQSGTAGCQWPLSLHTVTRLVARRPLSANLRLTSHVTWTAVRQWVVVVFTTWLVSRAHVTATTWRHNICSSPYI